MVALRKHLQPEVREDPGKAFGVIGVVIRVAEAAQDKEHGLGEGGQPGTVEVLGLEGLHERPEACRPLGHP